MPSQDKQKFRIKDSPSAVKDEDLKESPPEISSPVPHEPEKQRLVFKAKGSTSKKEKSIEFIKKDRAVAGEAPKRFTVKETPGEGGAPRKRFSIKEQRTDDISRDPEGGPNVRFSQKTVPEDTIEKKKSFGIKETKTAQFKVKKEEPPKVEKKTFQFKKRVEEEKTAARFIRSEKEMLPGKEVITFNTKEDPPDKERKTRVQGKTIEKSIEKTEYERSKTFITKKPPKKKKEFVKGLRKKISHDSLTKYKKTRVAKGIFARPILYGAVLSLFVIITVSVATAIKKSPSSSPFWRLCFLPQMFLVIVVLLGILYLVSLVMIIIGIVYRFKK